jgi:hypothetical protein
MLLLLLACSGSNFEDLDGVVFVGDNVAGNPSYAMGYPSLLQANDDALFPAFEGQGLDALGLDAVRLDRGGDSFYSLADDLVFTDVEGEVAVLIELGLNDLVTLALQLLDDEALRADPTPALDEFEANVDAVVVQALAVAAEDHVYIANIYDPSDGVGDLADAITTFFPFEGAENITPELALQVIEGFNAAIDSVATEHGLTVIDLHTHFAGHGLHANELAPDSDPTGWLNSVIDPNLRGAHEIRRLTWQTWTGVQIDDLPADLPVAATDGLPDVSTWAEVLVDSAVTQELDSETPNLASDPEQILGAPGGGTADLVALGVSGAWLIVQLDLTDGEGDDLVVLEFGAQSGGVPEPYRVEVSSSPDGPWTTLGDAYGERAFDLSGADAGYVRIESLATVEDVLGGMGSPYYPGPEFDAVGSVH